MHSSTPPKPPDPPGTRLCPRHPIPALARDAVLPRCLQHVSPRFPSRRWRWRWRWRCRWRSKAGIGTGLPRPPRTPSLFSQAGPNGVTPPRSCRDGPDAPRFDNPDWTPTARRRPWKSKHTSPGPPRWPTSNHLAGGAIGRRAKPINGTRGGQSHVPHPKECCRGSHPVLPRH
jgi:hypothetical protein